MFVGLELKVKVGRLDGTARVRARVRGELQRCEYDRLVLLGGPWVCVWQVQSVVGV